LRDSNGECTGTDEVNRTLQGEKRTRAVVLKVVDIDPQRTIGPSKGSINSNGVEWGSLNGQGVRHILLINEVERDENGLLH